MGGRLFGGLVQDVRRKASWYTSDFLDALHPQCLSAVLYIYLATITNAITFGGLLGEATDGAQVGGRHEGSMPLALPRDYGQAEEAPRTVGSLAEDHIGFQGVLESFLGTSAAGAAFCLMAGQPLTILSSTGPVLVFERLLFSFSR